VADKQTKLDLPAALRGADLAEGYTVSAVDFVLAALGEAEYAVLDAILAWADVDAAPTDGCRQRVTRHDLVTARRQTH
jgi:hypothetical protein